MSPFVDQSELGRRRSRRADALADLIAAIAIVAAAVTAAALLVSGGAP